MIGIVYSLNYKNHGGKYHPTTLVNPNLKPTWTYIAVRTCWVATVPLHDRRNAQCHRQESIRIGRNFEQRCSWCWQIKKVSSWRNTRWGADYQVILLENYFGVPSRGEIKVECCHREANEYILEPNKNVPARRKIPRVPLLAEKRPPSLLVTRKWLPTMGANLERHVKDARLIFIFCHAEQINHVALPHLSPKVKVQVDQRRRLSTL